MPDRLSALDASFLYLDGQATPMHVGAVAIFERHTGFDFDTALALVRDRLGYLPRYRQRVMHVPGNLARPVWGDDVDFDINYHVRRSALPSPGTDEQLFELVARLMARPLDHDRPLWEAYFVEGLTDDRVALVTKTHQALVDGIGTIELGQVVLEPTPTEPDESAKGDADPWRPAKTPSRRELLIDAVTETVQQPSLLVESARNAAGDAVATISKLAGVLGSAASALRTVVRPAPASPLNVTVSGGRVLAAVRTRLTDYRTIRAARGGTVNDIVLTVVTGAIREWMLTRGVQLSQESTVRALVPVAVTDPATPGYSPAGLVGNQVDAHLVDLPIGEPDPVIRLQHIAHAMARHTASGRAVAARSLLRLSGFAPATLHSLGARTAGSLSDRIFNVIVTNSPGPQQPMFAAQARLLEMIPIIPLMRNQALAIGVTSYDGGVYFGLNGDRKAVYDIDVVAAGIRQSLDELKGAGA
ncbi:MULTISPECIES: wax ester/triacylglycerol synthase family O-acyltransferase [Thermocrispum]|jgi:WS/DGAT/MGAT family acyltransferase|uniref:Diacylglycerol O-acyltransferase n=1 Tax=Thermocrispum agreste TaxID=37925 RepID=A0A2W4JEF4_9PSEU|nr:MULTISPECIES: wax ester/triacylglycerol synthase family O-acyltransferase [Thermocrispum]PZM96355.1 MAG: wax ester/triacylglycerol synthase family O-acyltransferase [Thermocrispum agreste]